MSLIKQEETTYSGVFPLVLPQRWPIWVAPLILVLITFAVYIPAIKGGFIWDDDSYVTNNPLLTASDGLWRIWMTAESPQYYPMVFTTFWVEHYIWGFKPMGYHIVNVALHAINSILLWLLLSRLEIKGAWLAGAVFALHPVHVESVAWITERKNLLSGMFYLLAMGSYLRFEDRKVWFWYIVALGLFLLALLSKTVTSTLPVVLLLILWLKRGRVEWRYIRRLIPFFVVGLVMGLLTVWYEVHHVGAQGKEWDLSFLERLLLAGRILWFYAIKLVWPAGLAFIYPRWHLDLLDFWQWVWPLGFLIVAGWFWWYREKVGRGPIVCLAYFSVTLFPALGFFDVYPMRYSFVADHFQYLASIGMITLVVCGVVWCFDTWGGRVSGRVLGVGLGVVILVLFGTLTWKQGYVYRDLETLWKDTIKKSPTAWMAHNNLGLVFFEQGRIEEAIKEYKVTLGLSPDHANVHTNLGVAYFREGRIEEAVKEQRIALKIDPDYANAHNNLGLIYFNLGIIEGAIKEYKLALNISPGNPGFHANLGRAYFSMGRLEDAIREYRNVVGLAPDNADAHYNLGAIYRKKGMFNEATLEFKKVLEIGPEAADVHYNLGIIYSLKGSVREAVSEFEEALRIDPDFEKAEKKLKSIVNLKQ